MVYTRRGANNDHVFRHRAPLFIAQVDPEKLVVLRVTERVVLPERGVPLGNFGVSALVREVFREHLSAPFGRHFEPAERRWEALIRTKWRRR